MSERLTYAESFHVAEETLAIMGEPIPNVLKQPAYDDEELGPSLFRTLVEEFTVENLTLPGFFIGRSEIRQLAMRNCDLRLSCFCWNDFFSCSFANSILQATDFRDSNYLRCDFTDTDLREADLRRTFFEQCDFSGANLTGAIAIPNFASMVNLTEEQHHQIQWTEDAGSPAPGG